MLALLTLLTVSKVKILGLGKWIITSNACLFNNQYIYFVGIFLLAFSCAFCPCKKTFFVGFLACSMRSNSRARGSDVGKRVK